MRFARRQDHISTVSSVLGIFDLRHDHIEFTNDLYDRSWSCNIDVELAQQGGLEVFIGISVRTWAFGEKLFLSLDTN